MTFSAAVVQVVGQVVAKADIPAGVSAEAMSVDPDDAVAKDAVEFDEIRRPRSRLGMVELAPIPADAVFREIRPDARRAMLDMLALVLLDQRQFDRPVVGQIDDSPFRVVEFHARRAARFAGFDQRAVAREFKIARRIGGMSQCESPVPIE